MAIPYLDLELGLPSNLARGQKVLQCFYPSLISGVICFLHFDGGGFGFCYVTSSTVVDVS